MPLMTIGAFARATRLSPKALRLYDDLGLLPPAAVDGDTGYRFYDPAQLERARLIAALRRLDMPLNRIRAVCDLRPGAAAGEVAAYWTEVRADTAARGRLATHLVDHLSGRSTMPDTDTPPRLRHAARSSTGLVRTSNEDTAYAGSRLLAVADGTRDAGALASAGAIDVLRSLEAISGPPEELLDALAGAVDSANRAVHDIVDATPADPPVTTLTAVLWSGTRFALAHIGDSRAYLLRDGRLRQLTDDHTWVRSQVDQGQLTPQQAFDHPQRALLNRALDGAAGTRADLSVHPSVAGDRYLLCSDGLSGVVPAGELHAALCEPGGADETVEALIGLAHRHGAPDNIACVVADVVTG